MFSRFHGPNQAAFYVNSSSMWLNLFKLSMVLMVLLLVFVSEEVKKIEKKDAPPAGNVCVTIDWDKGDYDVDEWFKAPNDVPVGYSNLGSKYGNLMRDDLGSPDPERNREFACTRGIPAGEYVANVHWYASRGPAKEMRVHAEVTVAPVKADGKGSIKTILQTDAVLDRVGQELTLFRFTLTEKGELVSGSVNSVFTPLRSTGTSGSGQNVEGGNL